jgi:hypothetical protein
MKKEENYDFKVLGQTINVIILFSDKAKPRRIDFKELDQCLWFRRISFEMSSF